MRKISGLLFAFVLCAMLALAGCSDSSSHSASTVSGIASSGAALSGTVTLKDANGEELGPEDIGEDGSFTFVVDGLAPPFVIKATAGDKSWYSYAAGPGTANVNPLTTLVLTMAAGVSDPAEVDDDDLENARQALQAIFANFYEAFGVDEDFNPFTGDCTVNHDGIDAFFDTIGIDMGSDGSVTVVMKKTQTPVLETTVSGITGQDPIDDTVTSELVWGTYNYCYLYFDTPTGGNASDTGSGSMTFVTDGTWTAVEETPSSEAYGGEYSMVALGKFVFDGNADEPGFMTPDREIVVMPDMDATDGDVGISILCKRDTSLSASDISGNYLIMELGRMTDGGNAYAASEIALIAFNGSGGYSVEGESGTYTVSASTGRITVNTPEGTVRGMVAKGGDVIVVPEQNPATREAGISVMVRTSSKDVWNESSLNGDYYLAELYSNSQVVANIPDPYAAYTVWSELIMNNGAISGHFLDSAGDEDDEVTAAYQTYNSHEEALVNLDYFLVEGTFLGIATPDGEFFVMMNDADEPEEAGISLGVKTVFIPD